MLLFDIFHLAYLVVMFEQEVIFCSSNFTPICPLQMTADILFNVPQCKSRTRWDHACSQSSDFVADLQSCVRIVSRKGMRAHLSSLGTSGVSVRFLSYC